MQSTSVETTVSIELSASGRSSAGASSTRALRPLRRNRRSRRLAHRGVGLGQDEFVEVIGVVRQVQARAAAGAPGFARTHGPAAPFCACAFPPTRPRRASGHTRSRRRGARYPSFPVAVSAVLPFFTHCKLRPSCRSAHRPLRPFATDEPLRSHTWEKAETRCLCHRRRTGTAAELVANVRDVAMHGVVAQQPAARRPRGRSTPWQEAPALRARGARAALQRIHLLPPSRAYFPGASAVRSSAYHGVRIAGHGKWRAGERNQRCAGDRGG